LRTKLRSAATTGRRWSAVRKGQADMTGRSRRRSFGPACTVDRKESVKARGERHCDTGVRLVSSTGKVRPDGLASKGTPAPAQPVRAGPAATTAGSGPLGAIRPAATALVAEQRQDDLRR